MRLLVIRTSAMGDVALTLPVISGMREQYPGIEIVVLTRERYRPFFSSVEGLDFIYVDFKGRHRGLPGLFSLFREIRRQVKIDFVIDLHDVIRSWIIRWLFMFSAVPVSVIDKGRGEKKLIVKGKRRKPLPHSVERYCNTFERAGFPVIPSRAPLIVPSAEAKNKILPLIKNRDTLHIGVAPYAKHKLKVWPVESMISLLRLISEKYRSKYWLFGGLEDTERLMLLEEKISDSSCVAGKLSLGEELALMADLDFMIAMDSANMHMAALTGTKVFSIWGGTDPLCGFGPWDQPEEFSVRISDGELPCRPCTVYGKGECKRGDLACLTRLTPGKVFSYIESYGIPKDGKWEK